MIQFRHTRISKPFIEACGEAVLSGRSVVLLGPRFGGKRYVHRELRDILSGQTSAPIFSFSIRTSDHVTGLEAIAYRRVQRDRGSDEQRGDPLKAISLEVQGGGERAILLAANVDRLPPEAARNFLERIRAMVENRLVTVVLSGTLDFRDLVSGPHSEFNCADQFVLQGFDEQTFVEEMVRFSRMHRLEWSGPTEDLKKLWQFTGGNRHLGRLLVMVAAEEFPGSGGKAAEASEKIFQRALRTDTIPSTYWSSLMRGPADLIAGAPDCWADLERLMVEGTVAARSLDGAPEELELSGIAIRESGMLHFASEFAERLVRSHFTATRLGDLYAQNGQWNEALKRYALRDRAAGVRPADREDRAALEASVHALGAAMFAAAAEGVGKVRELFISGSKALLGFSEISFWSRQKDDWIQEGSPIPVPEGDADRVAAYLRSAAEDAPSGLLLLPDSISRFAVAAILKGEVPERSYVVVLSGLAKRAVLSRDRNALASKLLTLFAGAHDHALQGQLNLRRLEVRNRHVDILNQIFDFLGAPAFDIRKILKLTGQELLKLGYRRVMFCLVDALRERIEGVMDIPGTHEVDLAKITDYPLNTKIVDLQQWVFHNARVRIVPDVRKEILASKKCHAETAIKAIAIVPILDRGNEVLGTIHIEREDGAVPAQQEVEDLELFGRQLARILAQNERMTLIQESMDESNEPIMITNPAGALVYANGTAAQELNISPGWQKTPIPKFPAGSKLVNGIAVALAQQRTSVHQVDDFGQRKNYRGEVVIAPLKDWRGQTIGCFVDVHDLRWLHNVIEALTKIGPAQSTEAAIEAVFEVVGSFGYRGIRLYVVDTFGQRLRSKKAKGLGSDEAMRRFNAGGVVLSNRERNGVHSWHVLKTREPAIYHWGQTDGIIYTKAGLAATSLANPKLDPELGKNPGDWWFEVPLYIGETEYGKISVDCTDELEPEAFETMRVLAQQSKKILEACQERENLASAHESAVREGIETSMAAVAHNLGSRLTALPIILARFQQREDRYPELKPINEDFSFLVDQSMRMIERIRELLGKITLRYSRFDVGEMIQRALSSSLAENQYVVTGERPGAIDADSGVLESALVELIQNSRQFAKAPANLRVRVQLEASNGRTVKLEYSDNGPGVPDEYKKRIFEEFFGHRPGMKKSTGLGLSFVRKALEAHGGSIIENGRPGSGVHFVMEIPVQETA